MTSVGRRVAADATEPGPPDGVFAWRREAASPSALTPIGRALFPGGTMRISGWRLALLLVEPAVKGLAMLVLGTVTALEIAGVALGAGSLADLAGGWAVAAFLVLALYAYVRTTFVPALLVRRCGTWPTSRLIAWKSDAWIDAASRPGGTSRQLVFWRADCPACGAPLQLVAQGDRGSMPPTAICTARPTEHLCTFDRTTMTGEWRTVARPGGRTFGDGRAARTDATWMDEEWT